MVELPRRWRPESEADIQRAIDDDLLSETHDLDCKLEVGAAKGERKNTARHLASFAIDGGALLIGVAEDKEQRKFTLAPMSLVGLVEQVEDLARAVIDPPLTVIPHEIDSAVGEGFGYLLVEVRPSPFAPAMVDGVYYGRGEKQRIRLSDAEVRRYHAQRRSIETEMGALLDEEIERDLVPAELRKLGHLYLVAAPLLAPPAIARALVREAGAIRLKQIIQAAESRLGSELAHYHHHPLIRLATRDVRRAKGMALCSPSAAGTGRKFQADWPNAEVSLVDIEFREDGGIRALIGLGTYPTREIGNHIDLVISEPVIVADAVRLTGWIVALASAIDYNGSWGLGLHVSTIKHLAGNLGERHLFDAEFYRSVTTASLADLEDSWQRVVDELVGSLLHALGTPRQLFADYLPA